jgi:hypothetical protein
MTQVRAGISAAPTALPRQAGAGRLSSIDPQPFRTGLTFGGRPSGPRIHGEFAVSFLSQLAIGKVGCSG